MKIKRFNHFLLENESGGGGGTPNATLQNTGGMGNVVSPTVGSTPGQVWGNGSGNVGSGDIPAYNTNNNFNSIMGYKKKKKKKLKKKKLKTISKFSDWKIKKN
jgi:hypothetical protein